MPKFIVTAEFASKTEEKAFVADTRELAILAAKREAAHFMRTWGQWDAREVPTQPGELPAPPAPAKEGGPDAT